eukprot:3273286-Rhodomonas_salina.5
MACDAAKLSLGKHHFLCLKQGNACSVLTFDDSKSLQDTIIASMSDAYPSIGCTGAAASVEDFKATAALYADSLSKVTMALGKPGGHVLLLVSAQTSFLPVTLCEAVLSET